MREVGSRQNRGIGFAEERRKFIHSSKRESREYGVICREGKRYGKFSSETLYSLNGIGRKVSEDGGGDARV